MEVVDFRDTEFHFIQNQDNPAFGDEECYMLVQDCKDAHFTIVLHIKPVENPLEEESVTKICKCWCSNKALEIAELLASKK